MRMKKLYSKYCREPITIDETDVTKLKVRLSQRVDIESYYPDIYLEDGTLNYDTYNRENNTITVNGQPRHIHTKVYKKQELRKLWLNYDSIESLETFTNSITDTSCIYKVISNHPIYTDIEQQYIKEDLIDKNSIANDQIVRYGKSHKKSREIIFDNNSKPQYRRLLYSPTEVPDQDLRTEDRNDYYECPELIKELMYGLKKQL